MELKEARHAEGDPDGTYSDYAGNKYTFAGDTTVINGGLRIADFKNGQELRPTQPGIRSGQH